MFDVVADEEVVILEGVTWNADRRLIEFADGTYEVVSPREIDRMDSSEYAHFNALAEQGRVIKVADPLQWYVPVAP